MNLKKYLAGSLLAALTAFAAMMTTAAAAAEDYPSHPIRLIVGYAAGGPTDVAARVYAKYLQAQIKQSVIVENRAGASGMVGASAVMNAPADGYTLYYISSPTMTITPIVQAENTIKPLTDFTYIGLLYDYANVLIVGENSRFKSVADLIAQARQHPNGVSYGSAGVGASNHLAGELLAQRSNVKMLHVPYKGNAPAAVDIMSGKIDFMFDVIGSAVNQVRGGKFKALAIASLTRSPVFPNVPTVAESGLKNFEVSGWYGLVGPRGLSQDIVNRLVKANAAVAANPDYKKWMEQYGYNVQATGPDELRQRVKGDIALWGPVIKAAKIRVE
ncbi:MAG: tripartite tricarboxylate transporter substrate binding protein [Burkholderiaceae bacterium]|jgi:tripartite-type tricarboxylate transporter receptor subunit TctC|nr:tripartite tricarboxylate transporter substrate binding protein [Burkholderiaceae bacterium]